MLCPRRQQVFGFTMRTCICRTLRHFYIKCNLRVPCPQPCMMFKHTGALFFISQAARVLRVTAASQPCLSSSRGGSSAERLSTVNCRLWTDDCGLWTDSAWAPLPSLTCVCTCSCGSSQPLLHPLPSSCPPLQGGSAWDSAACSRAEPRRSWTQRKEAEIAAGEQGSLQALQVLDP